MSCITKFELVIKFGDKLFNIIYKKDNKQLAVKFFSYHERIFLEVNDCKYYLGYYFSMALLCISLKIKI